MYKIKKMFHSWWYLKKQLLDAVWHKCTLHFKQTQWLLSLHPGNLQKRGWSFLSCTGKWPTWSSFIASFGIQSNLTHFLVFGCTKGEALLGRPLFIPDTPGLDLGICPTVISSPPNLFWTGVNPFYFYFQYPNFLNRCGIPAKHL